MEHYPAGRARTPGKRDVAAEPEPRGDEGADPAVEPGQLLEQAPPLRVKPVGAPLLPVWVAW